MIASFCCSLRKRSGLAPVVDILLRNNKPKWRESRLGTHDLAIPLSDGDSSGTSSFHFILLSSADSQDEETEQRLDRLYHLNGAGINAAVIFVMSSDGNAAQEDMQRFLRFQISVTAKFDMPILPVTLTESLPATITAFIGSLELNRARQGRQQQQPGFRRGLGPAQLLLPYLTVNPPLPERAVHVLSDVTDGIADLASKALSKEGQAVLKQWLDERDVEDVIAFWMHEHSVG